MHYLDLYDFLAETGADPYDEPDQSRENYILLALDHVRKNGPGIYLNWKHEGEI